MMTQATPKNDLLIRYADLLGRNSFTPNPNIEAILWDVDGTLVDSEPLSEKSLDIWLENKGIEATPDLHDALIGRTLEMNHSYLVSKYKIEENFETFKNQKMDILIPLMKDLKPRFQKLPQLLEKIHQSPLRQAAVSNGQKRAVTESINSLGNHYFEFSLAIEDTVDGKPSPTPYHIAADRLGVDIKNCLVVEDTAAGLQAALSAGAQTIIAPSNANSFEDSANLYKQAHLCIVDLNDVDWEMILRL